MITSELHQDMIDALRDAIFNLTHVLYGEEGQTAVQCSSNTEIVYGQNSTIFSPPIVVVVLWSRAAS